jgi:hypothetical protein
MRFKKFITYCSAVAVSILLLFAISGVQGKLDGLIEKHELRYTGQIKNAPPLVAFTTMAMGSFRGLLADLLWLRAASLQDQGNYFEMVQLASWITKLQPRFSGATAYLAWNMAYNISVTCSEFQDRWRWINRGIELIRDEALEYNPSDPMLYKELGWIFQHKIGNVLDDANLYYKNKLAISLTEIVGANPDWEKLAEAPKDYAAFLKKYPEKSRFWTVLKEAEYKDYKAFFKAYREADKIPEKFAELLNNPKELAALTDYFQAEWLRKKYKLDPRLIVKINKDYGALDWRLPEAQAIYWATKGLEATSSHKDISCERMITQSLKDAFMSGRLLSIDEKKFETIITVPNLNVVDSVLRVYNEAYLNNNKQNSFRSAKLNFYKDAIVTMYNYGRYKKAKALYKQLRKEEPGKYKLRLEAFVMKEWAEDVRDSTSKKATDVISGLITQSIKYMLYNDIDAALAQERMARYIWKSYMEYNADTKDRTGLAPYGKIKKTIVNSYKKNLPPVLAELLKAKLGEADAKKKKDIKEQKKELIEKLQR